MKRQLSKYRSGSISSETSTSIGVSLKKASARKMKKMQKAYQKERRQNLVKEMSSLWEAAINRRRKALAGLSAISGRNEDTHEETQQNWRGVPISLEEKARCCRSVSNLLEEAAKWFCNRLNGSVAAAISLAAAKIQPFAENVWRQSMLCIEGSARIPQWRKAEELLCRRKFAQKAGGWSNQACPRTNFAKRKRKRKAPQRKRGGENTKPQLKAKLFGVSAAALEKRRKCLRSQLNGESLAAGGWLKKLSSTGYRRRLANGCQLRRSLAFYEAKKLWRRSHLLQRKLCRMTLLSKKRQAIWSSPSASVGWKYWETQYSNVKKWL